MRLETAAPTRRRRISLTPLVDVVFLLMLFFVLAGRFEPLLELDLAGAGGGPAVADAPAASTVVVRLAADGARLAGTTTPLDDWLRAPDVPVGETRVLFSLAADATVDDLVSWSDRFRAAGFHRFAYLE